MRKSPKCAKFMHKNAKLCTVYACKQVGIYNKKMSIKGGR